MENTTGLPKYKWKKVKNVLIDPMVLIPVVLGFGFLYWTYNTTDVIFKSLLSFISAFGIGIGINHFTFLFKEQNEYQTLKFKAEHTIRMLNDRINSILRKEKLSNEDKDTIDGLLNLMDYWKDYYDKVDASKIAYHQKAKRDLENSTQEEKKKLQSDLDTLEYNLLQDGLTSYIGLSASTAYNYFKDKQ